MGRRRYAPVKRSKFSEALRTLRKTRGLTLAKMADLIGTSSRQYQRWEYGNRGGSDSAVAIAKALGLPPWHFEQAIIEDRQNALVYEDGDTRTMVKVGVLSWIASMSDAEWVEVRREALRRTG